MQNHNFPSYDEAWSAETRLTENLPLLAQMPWVLPASVRNRHIVEEYSVGGLLPCGTPTWATTSYDWLTRTAIPDTSLNLRVFGSVKEAREAHVRSILSRHGQLSMPLLEIGHNVAVDAYAYRTQGEIGYVRRLVDLDVSRWRGTPTVSNDALCWSAPLLRREFRYLSKINQPFWQWATWERRIRASSGLLSPYQCVEAETIHPAHRHKHFLRVPPGFSAFEMSRGCSAEVPPVVTYKGSEMGDIDSGYWTVFYSELAAKVGAWVLWDVYDSFKLWYVPRRARADMRAIRLDFELVCRENEELHELLEEIERIVWSTAEYVHTTKGALSLEVAGELAPGDFIWYDPWRKERVSREAAWERRSNKPEMPRHQVCGYVYTAGAPPDEDLAVAEGDAASDVILPNNGRGTVARESANRGGPSDARRSSGLDLRRSEDGAALPAWLHECGIPSSSLPTDHAGLVNWGRERLCRPRTSLCDECRACLCEACWAAYDADTPGSNDQSGPTGAGESGAGPYNGQGGADDDMATEYTATF